MGRNTEGKGEIARYERFLLYPQCFQKTFAADMFVKLIWGRVVNIVGKSENADYQHFLLFLQSFQKCCTSGSLKLGIIWKRINSSSQNLTF